MRNLSLKMKMFFLNTYIATFFLFFYLVYLDYIQLKFGSFQNIIFFSLLTALTESFTILIFKISFSTSFAITLASYILFGPFTAMLTMIIGFSLRIVRIQNGTYKHILNTPVYGTIFNFCALTLPLLLANCFYVLVGGTFGNEYDSNSLWRLVCFSIIYCIINTFTISLVIALNSKKNVVFCFINNIKLAFLNFLTMTPFGILLSVVFREYDVAGVLVIIIPILLVRYTFSLYGESKSQYIQTVDALMHAIEARDKYTEGHSQRVAEIVMQIGKKLKYNEWKIEQLNMAALLHDVGKIGISDAILNKPGQLTDDEFSTIKNHPVIGHKILSEIKNLEYISKIVKYHHERFDGKGYPEGKKGDELSLDIYIIQLADSVDAMSSDRPYRKALTEDEIRSEIEKNSGSQFHPKVAEIYLEILKK